MCDESCAYADIFTAYEYFLVVIRKLAFMQMKDKKPKSNL